MKHSVKYIAVLAVIIVTSCKNETSLQEYFVAKHEDNKFIAMDVPASLLDPSQMELNEDEKQALQSIKKINLLALRNDQTSTEKYETEKEQIHKILSSDKYQSLMRFGSNGINAEVKYLGEEDAIDEVIIFGSDPSKGLALIRVLGDDIKPENIAKVVQSLEKNEESVDVLQQIIEVLN